MDVLWSILAHREAWLQRAAALHRQPACLPRGRPRLDRAAPLSVGHAWHGPTAAAHDLAWEGEAPLRFVEDDATTSAMQVGTLGP